MREHTNFIDFATCLTKGSEIYDTSKVSAYAETVEYKIKMCRVTPLVSKYKFDKLSARPLVNLRIMSAESGPKW